MKNVIILHIVQIVLIVAILAILVGCDNGQIMCPDRNNTPKATVSVVGTKLFVHVNNKGEDRYELEIYRMHEYDKKSTATVLTRKGFIDGDVDWEFVLEPGVYRIYMVFYHQCYSNGSHEITKDFEVE
jgi:hypothetical protein